ncbi:protein PAT1 homolog 1 [Copidosoma floridanum]|uniref:protein PAT1 homolog 1 n=1 Tax=Copidosoma floridanum TaxID=29053 RepID=UPI0006C9AD91|nr:protein PAT1 homolog 1 [Copidosoma floridanum]
MQPRQMADSFFGFDTSHGAGLDDGLDYPDDEDFQEENYDALNDETFGSDAGPGDWEEDHEKLAQITESNRSRLKNDSSKSESEIDVEKSLSHLVLDERDLTIPKPGVWDSPTNFSIAPTPILPKPLLSATLKNACTVEELERGLISNRPPPGLTKPPISQSSNTNAQNLLLNSITSGDKLPPINGIGPHQGNQYPLVLPPNVRLGHPPSLSLPNVGQLLNQTGNLLRYQLPPHLLMQAGNQRQPPLPGNFPLNNFPHHNSRLGPFPFIRPDHPMMGPHNNHHQSMQHHNMHMGNQRNQNNKFCHDRQDNHHQPFFRNNQYYHQNHNNMRYHNQGHHGYYQNMNHHYHQNNPPSNGIGPSGELDEYAGLMNHREKQWLHSIQLLQLNTTQPYVDDYYYTVFCYRMNKKNENHNGNKINNNSSIKKCDNMKGGRNSNNNNSNGYRDSRDRDQQQQPTIPKPTTPMQFENSLGKLQYSSVTAPRKIIDMDVVPNSDPHQTPTVQQKDTKKTRQLLLEIERMYVLLLKLEDIGNPIAILADQQREQLLKEQQQQAHQDGAEPVPVPEKKDPVKEKEELVSSIMTSLLQFVQEDKLTSLFSIRKGKMMFLRFLSCINVKKHEENLNKLWVAVIKGLTLIGRKDSQLLFNFYVEFIKCMNDSLLMNLSKELIESTNQPSKSNNLAAVLTNKFGLSVISMILMYAEDISSHENDVPESFAEQWPKFLQAIFDCATSTPVVAPWDYLKVENLRSHLKRHGIESQSHLTIFELYFTEANPVR